MATYTFSTLAAGQHIDFDPAVDLLSFDLGSYSASGVVLTSSGANLSLTCAGKTVWLDATSATQLAAVGDANITFANGSLLAIGDATTNPLADAYGQTYDLATSTVGNQVWGMGGADNVVTGSGADWIVGNTALIALDQVSRAGTAGSPNASQHATVSADGRFVAFKGGWTGFGSSNDNAVDVFVKDMNSGSVSDQHLAADGTHGSSGAGAPAISADGKSLAFVSASPNLVPGPASGASYDIYVADVAGSGIQRVSTGSSGQLAANGGAANPDLSADGRYVVFDSNTSNWASGGTDTYRDIFLKDRVSGSLTRLSTSVTGGDGNGSSSNAKISADGRFVAFQSAASNLTAGDTNGQTDIFVWDRSDGSLSNLSNLMPAAANNAHNDCVSPDAAFDNGYGGVVVFETYRGLIAQDTNSSRDIYAFNAFDQSVHLVSSRADGSSVALDSTDASVSGDGRFAVFTSYDDSLVAGDTNRGADVFVKDLISGAIALVSRTTGGAAANGQSGDAEISLGGDWIVFESNATNLGSADGNGTSADVFRVSNPLLKDTLQGGAGNDTYVVSRADTIVEADGGGTDTVKSAISWTLGANLENLVLTATGAANGTGNSLNNVITAGAGNNVLNGGSGTDTVSYASAAAGVTVSLVPTTAQATGGSGSDTLTSFENLTGSGYNDTLTGSAAANTLNGGKGADKMTGGDGSDRYYVDASGDIVTESNADAATGGTDTVYNSIHYTLGANVENLGINGSGAVNGTGNSLNNLIYAGAGDNVLNGGSGTDTVSYANAAAAVTASLALATAQATGGSGSDTLGSFENLTGSKYNDKLTGNTGNNVLDGGVGVDTMKGGAGNDTYVVDNSGDVVDESSAAGGTVQASTTDTGAQPDGANDGASVSADGRYVAFSSDAFNLVSGDPDPVNATDIFVKDLQTGAVVRASATAGGAQANALSVNGSLSADGRHVVFCSYASNLVSGDTNAQGDIFVKDLQTGAVVRASTSSTGVQGNAGSIQGELSADGRYVTFESEAKNLVTGDTNNVRDVFVKDLQTGTLQRVSTTASGGQANSYSYYGAMSADDRYVLMVSNANNLMPGDANNTTDIFMKDLQTGAITLLSGTAAGGQGNKFSTMPSFSADGKSVVFYSQASNLTADDTNNVPDVFIKNLASGAVLRLSTTSTGGEADGSSQVSNHPLSDDGRYLVFMSDATNLVAGDTNDTRDIFVKDLQSGTVARVDLTAAGGQTANGDISDVASISADGRFIVFETFASGLAPGDTNNNTDVYRAANPLAASGGVDTVKSSITYTLGTGIENLTLTGSAAINGTGNSANNVIVGNGANNVLKGNAGNDTLTGGAGADNFVFASALNASTNKDTVTDFTSGSDRLSFDDAAFPGIGAVGALPAGAYYAGTAAHDSSDRVIYDLATGNLYFDADGNGAAAKVLFASLGAGHALAVSDLWIT